MNEEVKNCLRGKTTLPNNCRAGKFKVFPTNWNTSKADLSTLWNFTYRFYDDNLKQVKKIKRMGMNIYPTLAERQSIVERLILIELEEIKEKGYNPITKSYSIKNEGIISQHIPFLDALHFAFEKLNVEKTTKIDIKSNIRYLTQAAKALHFDRLTIGEIKRKHLKILLDKCGEMRGWSANTFNKYRAHLSMLFTELLEYEAVDANYLKDIRNKKVTKTIKQALTIKERQIIDLHLRKKGLTSFRLFNRIFYHSGIRLTEVLRLKGKDVDLEKQVLRVFVKKGKQPTEKIKTIKNIAVRYWKLALKNCKPDDYIFSVGLVPGLHKIRPDQIKRRWRDHVQQDKKMPVKITAGYYAHKYANTTEMMDETNIEAQDAAVLNSHNSTAMVINIYDTKQHLRQHEKLKKVNNRYV